jgi:hypothetical protein
MPISGAFNGWSAISRSVPPAQNTSARWLRSRAKVSRRLMEML